MDLIPANHRLHAYQALGGPTGIRLISLEPALLTEEPLQISFITGNLSEFEAQYEAISYTWGGALLDHELHVNDGTCVQVTANLDRALRHLRFPVTNRWLWADAACINQNDDAEKAMQIPLMTQIFRNATRVLAWAGGGAEEEQGMRFMSKLSRSNRDAVESQLREEIIARDNVSQTTFEITLRQFLSLSWFNRLWIVQEIVFNHDVTLICRKTELSWSRLVGALVNLHTNFPITRSEIGEAKIKTILNIARLWRYHCTLDEPGAGRLQDRPDNVVTMMNNFAAYGCADARDRIYALYSMIPELVPCPDALTRRARSKVFMNVDYSLSVRETYHTFAEACIVRGYTIDILNAVLSRQYSPKSKDWPSWVPDWRQPPSNRHISPSPLDFTSIVRPREIKYPESSAWSAQGALRVSLRPSLESLGPEAPTVSRIMPLKRSWRALSSALHELSFNFSSSVLSFMLQHVLQHSNFVRWNDCISLVRHIDTTQVRSHNPPQQFSDVVEYLLIALQGLCFFVARAPRQPWYTGRYAPTSYVGYGNTSMQHGDLVHDFHHPIHHTPGSVSYAPALLLRPIHMTESTEGVGLQLHRLIGTAYISAPCTREGLLEQRQTFADYKRRWDRVVDLHLV